MESFGHEDQDPRAFASEGHLDSLGLCIFLAFVKKFNQGCPLIILDDVVTTIDSTHRQKIPHLLFDKFGNCQLIITTCDEIWYEQLVAFQRSKGIQHTFMNLEIIDWDENSGPLLSNYKPQWEKIEEKLTQGDRRAGSDARTYLEWLLKRICEGMKAQVEFKEREKYTLYELFDPAEKRIRDLLKDDCELKGRILNRFSELRGTMFMANLLSHDNIVAGNLSIEEVRSFCNGVHTLHEEFLCPECGAFLKYIKDGGNKVVKCSNPRCGSPINVETR